MTYVCGFSPQTNEMQACGTSSKVLWKVKGKTGHSLKLSISAFKIKKLKTRRSQLPSHLLGDHYIVLLYAYVERRKSFYNEIHSVVLDLDYCRRYLKYCIHTLPQT